jgi:hypothetical protein
MARRYALLLGLTGPVLLAQIPVAYWGHTLTGPGNSTNMINTFRGSVTGPDGEVYTVGEFANNLDLDPGPEEFLLSSTGQTDFDLFMARYDSLGQFVWGKQLVSAPPTAAFADLIERQPGGDLIIAGYLGGATDFDPGPGVMEVTGSLDLFFARYTPDGELVWAKTFGSVSGVDRMHDMEVDAEGNIWIAGAHNDTIDLDPGEEEALFPCTASVLDGFFAKYDPDGNYLWGHSFGNSWGDECKAIAFLPSGDAVITGHFRTSIDLDPSPGTFILDQLGNSGDAFIATYSTTGDLLSAFAFGGGASSVEPMDIAVDPEGDIIACGEFYGGQASLVPGQVNGTINLGSYMWGWVAKYSSGPSLLWSDLFATSNSNGPGLEHMALDAAGNVHVTGVRIETFDADPGPGSETLFGAGAHVIKLDNTDGALEWTVNMGGTASTYVEGIATDTDDHIYLTGGNKSWNFNGSFFGGGNNALLLKTGECLPPTILTEPTPSISDHCSPAWDMLEVEAVGTQLSYLWTENGAPVGTDADTLSVGPLEAGNYGFTCHITGYCGADTTEEVVIGVAPTPEPVIIDFAGTLTCTGATGAYQWYLNGAPIPGANSSAWVPQVDGTYTVTVADNVCVGLSDPFYFGGIGLEELERPDVEITHVPGATRLHVLVNKASVLMLFDQPGQESARWMLARGIHTLDLSHLSPGVYIARAGTDSLRILR